LKPHTKADMASTAATAAGIPAGVLNSIAHSPVAKIPAAQQLWQRLATAASRFFSADGNRSDDLLVEVVHRDPVAATAFLRAVMIFSGVTGAIVSGLCILFLSIFWSQSAGCERPLRWWLLVHTLVQLLQVPVRFVILDRIRSAERAQSSMEECVAAFTASPAWRASKNVSLFTYGWCVLGVVWVINAGDCAGSGIYMMSVFVLFQAAARTAVAFVSYRWLFPIEAMEEEAPKIEGATPDQIAALPLVSYSPNLFAEPGASCAVCLSEFDYGDRLRRLPCGHYFHRQCADEWMRRNKRCPLCIRAIDEVHSCPRSCDKGDKGD
jgi:hypothetical protein